MNLNDKQKQEIRRMQTEESFGSDRYAIACKIDAYLGQDQYGSIKQFEDEAVPELSFEIVRETGKKALLDWAMEGSAGTANHGYLNEAIKEGIFKHDPMAQNDFPLYDFLRAGRTMELRCEWSDILYGLKKCGDGDDNKPPAKAQAQAQEPKFTKMPKFYKGDHCVTCSVYHPKHKAAADTYNGIGRGWVEFDKNSNAVDVGYYDDEDFDNEKRFWPPTSDMRATCTREGNIRICADFSCGDCLLYADPRKIWAEGIEKLPLA